MFCLSMNVKITFNIFNFHFNNFLKQVFYKSYRSNLFLSIKEQLSFKTPIATVRSIHALHVSVFSFLISI